MNISTQQIADLEWVNYAASAQVAEVTSDLEVCLSNEVILTSSKCFPYPDSTHACLLRATPETTDGLIDRIIDYFKSRALLPSIFLSPACSPADLAERLIKRGFIQAESEEAWLVFNHLLAFPLPPSHPVVTVAPITQAQVATFVKVMMMAFEIPAQFEPDLVQLTQPSVHLPTVHHYLAWVDGQPVGTASLICHGNIGTLGGVGVVRAYRKTRTAINLVLRVFADAQKQDIDTILLQTTAATPLERLLCIHGFERAFSRVAYSLHD